ncbi:hypothetical protein [Nonomuraea africana]|uniref:Uncharacterized protein n=1 Tax=Nonomuraea africana TaxID=46171 RepID=A0ABR9K5U2_9ACTN|nr:hypothetical protein [Nonomuraea africana]MBE1557374.1 hypothetical protein [Nonomuraea africana]
MGGHGGESEPERTAWIAASGPGVPGDPPAALEQADVHAHVLFALGIAPRPEWALAGRPFSARSRVAH